MATSAYRMEEKRILCRRILLKTILIPYPTCYRELKGMGVNQRIVSREGEPIPCFN
jgi:hypothetical protein